MSTQRTVRIEIESTATVTSILLLDEQAAWVTPTDAAPLSTDGKGLGISFAAYNSGPNAMFEIGSKRISFFGAPGGRKSVIAYAGSSDAVLHFAVEIEDQYRGLGRGGQVMLSSDKQQVRDVTGGTVTLEI